MFSRGPLAVPPINSASDIGFVAEKGPEMAGLEVAIDCEDGGGLIERAWGSSTAGGLERRVGVRAGIPPVSFRRASE